MSAKYEVPPELQDLLLEFTVAVLVEEPRDIVDFAVCYFSRLRDYRRGAGGKLPSDWSILDMLNWLRASNLVFIEATLKFEGTSARQLI